MSVFGLMKYWTRFLQKLFNIKYEISGYWLNDESYLFLLLSYPILFLLLSYPILKINNKTYPTSIIVLGGNLYNEDDTLRRKAIFYWFFK